MFPLACDSLRLREIWPARGAVRWASCAGFQLGSQRRPSAQLTLPQCIAQGQGHVSLPTLCPQWIAHMSGLLKKGSREQRLVLILRTHEPWTFLILDLRPDLFYQSASCQSLWILPISSASVYPHCWKDPLAKARYDSWPVNIPHLI